MTIYDMDKKTYDRYNELMEELDNNLELKMSIHERLMVDLIEQVYMNKLNIERDEDIGK